jgi:uncharacterized membrane protein YidH (DUF202 family)
MKMGVEALVQAGQAIANAFSGANGLGAIFVAVGLAILLAIGIGFGLYILVNFIRQIPRMTVGQFLKFIVFSAVTLIVVGVILP